MKTFFFSFRATQQAVDKMSLLANSCPFAHSIDTKQHYHPFGVVFLVTQEMNPANSWVIKVVLLKTADTCGWREMLMRTMNQQ